MSKSVSYTYNSTFGSSGTGNGEFAYPSGIAVYDDQIFVVDKQNNRIQIFDLTGTYVDEFGSEGTGDDNFYFPEGICIMEGQLLIVDSGNHRIKIHETDGTFVSEFGSEGDGDNQFEYPMSIYYNSNLAKIYIADKQNNRIVIYDSSSYTQTNEFGTYGTGTSNLNFPEGIAYFSGNLLVADSANSLVKTFNTSGIFQNSDFDTDYPVGLAVSDDVVFVVDRLTGIITAIDDIGNTYGDYGEVGSGEGQFYFPQSAYFYDDQLFITDSGNNRIVILDITISDETPVYADRIVKLTRQLYPTGRAWYLKLSSKFSLLHEALAYSESRALSNMRGILDSTLPDNDNFDEQDATNWESALGIYGNSSLDLETRKLKIKRRMQYPGTQKARQHYLFIQSQLQAVDFDVYIYENRFYDSSDESYYTINPVKAMYGTVTYDSAYYGQDDYEYSVIANSTDEDKDANFNFGSSQYAMRATFFIGGETFPSRVEVDADRKDEFRELVLKLKPAQTVGFALVDYV